MKRKQYRRQLPEKIARIERKCDRILTEIHLLRRQLAHHSEADDVIDRLHRTARRMRYECDRERQAVRKMLSSKTSGI